MQKVLQDWKIAWRSHENSSAAETRMPPMWSGELKLKVIFEWTLRLIYFLQKFVQSSGLLKHNKRFCKFQKQKKPAPDPEEVERIALIAKAQFETYRVRKVEKKIEALIEESDENCQDTEMKEDPKTENSEFISIDIKEEPLENDGDTWHYEYLDEAIVKCEEIIDENMNPVVAMEKLEDDEIQRWKCDDDFKVPDMKKPRKLYNDGKPRTIHTNEEPKKFTKSRVRRKLPPGEFYTCDVCGKQYENWMSILTHVSTVHKVIGDFPCEFCNKLFKSSGNLKRHISSIHDNIRSHVCHICARAFSTNSKLMHHLKVHDEPEECKICGKFAKNMEDHVKRHNQSNNRTFMACPTCGKLFDKNVLQVHIDRVHAKSFNGNIFRCDDCDINYTRREDWRQ